MSWGGGDIPALSAVNVRKGTLDLSRTSNFGSSKLYEKWMTHGDPRKGDVVLTTEAPMGNVAQLPDDQRYILSQRVVLLRPHIGTLVSDYLAWLLSSKDFQTMLGKNETGTTVGGIRAATLVQLPVKFPPLNEQRRIVAKIEALNEKSTRAKQALDAVPPLLEKLRQSILAAAFRGDLTKDWRAKNPNVEPASKLLERIRKERRARWEEAELAKLKAKGKTPSDDKWKQKYEEPEPVNTEGLPELPEGWCWASGADLFDWASGNRLEAKTESGAFPVFGGNGISGRHSEALTTGATIIVGRVGANCGNVHFSGEPCWVTDNAIYALNPVESINMEYVVWAFRNADLRASAGGSGQPFINQQMLDKTTFAFPPKTEQEAVLRALHGAFHVATKLAALLRTTDNQIQAVNSSVLSKAFRGELVPQDPNDEPASVLLERIRRERENAASDGTLKAAGGRRVKNGAGRRKAAE
jgi:type I restriction enzyme S subunit